MNYYERHIGDYIRDTAHLSLLEHGIYNRLLDVYYTREAPIPDAQAARLVGARSEDERAALGQVLGEFFQRDGDVWRQRRCDETITAHHVFMRSQAEKAKAGAAARWKGKASPDDARGHSAGMPGASPDDARSIDQAMPNDALPLPTSHFPLPTSQDGSNEPSRKRGARPSKRVPESFAVTPELRSWASANHPSVDIDRQTELMRDYEFRRPYSDWPGVWRRWMARAAEAAPGVNGSARRKTRFEELHERTFVSDEEAAKHGITF